MDATLESFRLVNVTIDSAAIQMDDSGAVALPEQVIYSIYKNGNCTTAERGWIESLQLEKEATLVRRASFSKSLSSGYTLAASFTFPKIGGNASYKREVTLTNSSGWDQTERQRSSESRTINMTVGPGKVLFVKLQRTIASVRVPFTGTIIADGVVEGTYVWVLKPYGVRIPVPIRFPIADLLPPEKRTFSVAGFLDNSSLEELQVLFSERVAAANSDCDGGVLGTPSSEALKTSTKSGARVMTDKAGASQAGRGTVATTKNQAAIEDVETLAALSENAKPLLGVAVSDVAAAGLKFGYTVDEYDGSKTIQTGNAVAHVWVRHLSMGPGACAVTTRTDSGRQVGVTAMPGVWSPWQEIENAIGRVTMRLTDDVKCDTGVRSQVQYWKDDAASAPR